jgi:hypothetical protein
MKFVLIVLGIRLLFMLLASLSTDHQQKPQRQARKQADTFYDIR